MAEIRKSYGSGCIAAHALDLIGDRWALMVVRELMLGPRRFGAIRAALPGIATNMLARRLDDLETAGVAERHTLPPPAAVQSWRLTPAGLSLWPVLRELCRWGSGMAGHDPRLPMSPTALMLSMRAMFDPARADGRSFEAGFLMEGEAFLMTASPAGIEVARAPDLSGALRFSGRPNDLAPLIYGPLPLARSIDTFPVTFQGDPAMGQAFIDCFALRRAPKVPVGPSSV